MFCPNCGTECSSKFCPNCGTQIPEDKLKPADEPIKAETSSLYIQIKDPPKKWPTFFLCLFLGMFGVHRFYAKKFISGFVYLAMTFLDPFFTLCGVFFDLFCIITNSFFIDHHKMVEQYQTTEHKEKIDGWLILTFCTPPFVSKGRISNDTLPNSCKSSRCVLINCKMARCSTFPPLAIARLSV